VKIRAVDVVARRRSGTSTFMPALIND
jgi:hypothetical protein